MARAAASSSAYHAVADPTRRTILELLRDGERTVSELQRPLAGISQSALSQHLAVRRSSRLVVPRREGRHRYYRLRPAPLAEIAAWIRHFERFWDLRLERLGAYLDRKAKP